MVRYDLVGSGSDFFRESTRGYWDLDWETHGLCAELPRFVSGGQLGETSASRRRTCPGLLLWT